MAFLKIEDKSGHLIKNYLDDTDGDDLIYSTFFSDPEGDTDMQDWYGVEKIQVDEEQEDLLYRLRLNANKTRHIFFCTTGGMATLAFACKAALLLLDDKKYSALEMFNRALHLEPNHFQILGNKLDLMVKLPDTSIEEVKQTIKTIFSINSIHPSATHYALQLAVYANDIEKAVHHLRIQFRFWYLEKDTEFLMEKVFSILSEDRAKVEMGNLFDLVSGKMAQRVLTRFITSHKEQFNWTW